MVVTFEGDNLKEEEVVERDSGGRIVKLNLPERLVLIANHQVCVAHFRFKNACASRLPQIYADWLYLWCLTYKSGTQKDVLIMLKDSLKWIPLIGWVRFALAPRFQTAPHSHRESIKPMLASGRKGNASFPFHLPCPVLGFRPRYSL